MIAAIYLSPHNDDICFSLGGTVLSNPGGHLVNIYTVSAFTKARKLNKLIQNALFRLHTVTRAGPRNITELRNAEDHRFAQRCHLQRHDLALPEPALSNLQSKSLKHLKSDLPAVEDRLLDLLYRLADTQPQAEQQRLYCPMGIGGHRNHMAVLLVVLRHYAQLRQRFNILFYEDLPYASHPATREQGLKRFRRLVNRDLRRSAHPLSAAQFEAKLGLVALYPSQFKKKPQAAKFIPADSPHSTPHEAVWEIVSAG